MRSFMLFAVAIALSACSQTVQSVDTAIRQSLPQICAAADIGHAAFIAVIPTGKLSEKTIARETTAYSQIVVYCANKETATLASTLTSAVAAYAVMTTALKEAKRVEN